MGRESSYNECDDSNVGERGFRSQSPNDSEMAISCDPGPNRVFENRKAERVEQKPAGRIGNETRFGQPKPAGRRKANTTLKDRKADGGAGSARNS